MIEKEEYIKISEFGIWAIKATDLAMAEIASILEASVERLGSIVSFMVMVAVDLLCPQIKFKCSCFGNRSFIDNHHTIMFERGIDDYICSLEYSLAVVQA